MRFNKILLISPRYPGSHYSGGRSTQPPVGLGVIGEILKQEGVDYEVVDLGLGYSPRYLMRRIEEYRPDAVGISMMTFRYTSVYSVLGRIKEHHKGMKIIAGGPHITAWRERVLQECPAVDFGVTCEGEHAIRELCRGAELSAIKGLLYKDGEDIRFTGERELIEDLDSIPFPTYEKFELGKYETGIRINTSRGCPYACIFCQSCSVLGKKWRSRSAANVADEVQFWCEKGYGNFSFIDDNFTMSKKRVYELCDEIERRHLDALHLDAPGVRVDLVDRALLKRMREVGFRHVGFGIEAGNNRILMALKKGFTIEQAGQAVGDAVDLGYAVKLYFLVGSPHETLRDVRDSIDFALKYQIDDANFGSLMPIPETELMDWVRKEGRLLSPPEVYLNEYAEFERVPHFDAPGMTLEERRYALELTEKAGRNIRRKGREGRFKKQLAHLGPVGLMGAKLLSFELSARLLNSGAVRPLKRILKKCFSS